MQMIGQEYIERKIDVLTLDTLPKTLLIQGEVNDYQYEVLCRIGLKVDLPWLDITDALSLDLIMNISVNPEPSIYYIYANKITEKEQNIILKFLEEPPDNAWLVLLADTYTKLLSTVINRCVIWKLAKYDMDTINNLTDDPFIRKYSFTPKDVEMYSNLDIKSISELAKSLVQNIAKARFSNCLVITGKLAFKDDDFGYPVLLFLQFVKSAVMEEIEESSNLKDEFGKLYSVYNILTSGQRDMLTYPAINKEWLFNNMLLAIKRQMMR